MTLYDAAKEIGGQFNMAKMVGRERQRQRQRQRQRERQRETEAETETETETEIETETETERGVSVCACVCVCVCLRVCVCVRARACVRARVCDVWFIRFPVAAQVPGKEEFHETIRYFKRRVRRARARAPRRTHALAQP